jgi:hypothetical protein
MGRGFEHMRQQRLARHGMQHFWQRGTHARSLAGREHDSETGSTGHSNPSTPDRRRRLKAFSAAMER